MSPKNGYKIKKRQTVFDNGKTDIKNTTTMITSFLFCFFVFWLYINKSTQTLQCIVVVVIVLLFLIITQNFCVYLGSVPVCLSLSSSVYNWSNSPRTDNNNNKRNYVCVLGILVARVNTHIHTHTLKNTKKERNWQEIMKANDSTYYTVYI